ncbi:TPA: helix-turn-helix domain-containing protein [Enterococcus faecium]
MIEDYIEKDILRQVKIVEYFIDLNSIKLKDLANNLNVTSETIRRDFSRIETILEDKIEEIGIELSICRIKFFPQYTRYDLIKLIYEESRFLRVCSRYIMGIKDYISIVEEEYISVSKAFQLKKKVEKFFSTTNYLTKDNDSIEFKTRFLILSVWMRCDLLDKSIQERLWNLSVEFTNKILNHFSNNLNPREYNFFVKGVYLMLTRSKRQQLDIPLIAYNYMSKSIVFDKMKVLAKEFFSDDFSERISKDELIYLSIIFRMLPYNPRNYTLLKMDYEYQRKRLIGDFPFLNQIILSFEKEFEISLLNNIRFEKPFISFILSSILETQLFLVDKHFFISDSRLDLKNKITKIFSVWENTDNRIKYIISNLALERFCVEVHSLLVPKTNKNRFIVVVAENDDSHIEYRESISTYITGTDMILDDTMYYSLEEVPEYYDNHIIICERLLLTDSDLLKNNTIYPISLSYLNDDLKMIFTQLYFNVKI